MAPGGRSAGTAFGLSIDSGFAIGGVTDVPAASEPGARVAIDLAPRDDVEGALGTAAERMGNPRFLEVASHPDEGYLLRAGGWGSHWISAAGDRVLCAPPAPQGAAWQRFLRGQVLPFAAVLRGIEPLHAAAVVLDGRALVLAGPSGAGKSTLSKLIAADAARLLADDVCAVEPRGAGLLAHAGPAPVGWERHAEGVPLGTLCLLRRGGTELRVEPPRPLEPATLLAATFNVVVRTPARLERQLEVCARIARGTVLEASIPATAEPAEAAAAIVPFA